MAKRHARRASVLGRPLGCVVCQGDAFYSREIKLQTTGMTFFDLDWANESAEGVVCLACGYVHTFAGSRVEWGDDLG